MIKRNRIFSIFLLTGVGLIAQPTLSIADNEDSFIESAPVLFSCDFQKTEETLKLFTAVDLDNNMPSAFMKSIGFGPQQTGGSVVWNIVLRDNEQATNIFCGSTSQYTPAGQANDWLITIPITIPSVGYELSWKSQSYDPQKRDGLKVFVSTTGNQVATDFTEPAIFEVEEEESGPTTNIEGEWAEHVISLDAYAGKTVWVAFVNQSNDKSLICIDDIKIERKVAYSLELDIPRYVAGEEIAVKGKLNAAGDKTITNYTVKYRGADQVIHSQVFEGLSIAPGESHTFEFSSKMALQKGQDQTYQVWCNVPDELNLGVTTKIGALAFAPERVVVVEEGTGTWCGNCPYGVLAIEYLHELYPDNFIPIAVHNKDVMACDYDSYLGIVAFPSGYVNRHKFAYPIRQEADNTYTFDGETSFYKEVRDALDQATLVQISSKAEFVSADSMSIQVTSSLDFAMNQQGLDYRVLYVLLEDNVKAGAQSNYLYSQTNPIFGEWGKGGKYGVSSVKNYLYQDVARGIFPSFKGNMGELPSTVEIDKKYEHTYTIEVPKKVFYKSNLRVVALVLDNKTNEIMNAYNVKNISMREDANGIGELSDVALMGVSLQNQTLVVRGEVANLKITNLSGPVVLQQSVDNREIDIAGLNAGVYIVTMIASDGMIQNQKIIIP